MSQKSAIYKWTTQEKENLARKQKSEDIFKEKLILEIVIHLLVTVLFLKQISKTVKNAEK